MEEDNQRLTRCLSAVITGKTAALRSWLLTNAPTPYCLCKTFLCKACPGIESLVKSKTLTFHRHLGPGQRTTGRQGSRALPGRNADTSASPHI